MCLDGEGRSIYILQSLDVKRERVTILRAPDYWV
jgi:hypothetical protein